MDHSQRGANTDASNATSESSSLMSNVLFREIHKNAFLKRHSSDRRTGFPRKSEKVWVVFCVHDDVEPFLEIYPDQKVALTHKPEWFASLSNVLHVSPTICGHEDEFEFAVTLSFQVVRLSAPSWESMMEWVETIRNKLRELKVLCPKENIYSKMPEQKQPLLPTRDPNSPLPLPPEGPSTLLPGVELVHLETRNTPASADNNESSRPLRNLQSRSNINHERRVMKKRVNLSERPVPETSHLLESSENSVAVVENHQEVVVVEGAPSSSAQLHKPRAQRTAGLQPRPSTSGTNITVIEVSTSSTDTPPVPKNSSKFDAVSDNEDTDEDVFLISSVNQKVCEKNCVVNVNEEEAHYEHVFLPSVPVAKPQILQSAQNRSNVNCIPVDGSKSKRTHSTSLLISPNNSNQINSSQTESVPGTSSANLQNNTNNNDAPPSNSACVSVISNADTRSETSDANGPLSPQTQSKLEKVNISGLIPRVPAKSSKAGVLKPACILGRDGNAAEGRRNSSEGGSQPVSNEEHPGNKVTNGESSRANAIPAYSQVKKIHKGKTKSEEPRAEEQKASPVLARRKMPEIQLVETESQGNKKPESHVISSGSKNPTGLPETKVPNNINHSQRLMPGRKQDLGNVTAVSNSEYRNSEVSGSCPSTSGNRVDNGTRINLGKKDSFGYCNNNPEIEPMTATVQPAVGVISVEDIPLIGGHQRRRRRSSSSDAAPGANALPTRGIGGADRIRINIPTAREVHRNEAETRSSSHTRAAPTTTTTTTTAVAEPNSQVPPPPQSSRLTLREQQVLQLKKEMLHPGGVRLQLRRKDCTGSIALVDVLNGVWVAGWKQKEHPLLYNALHIGDQLVSVGDVLVRSAAEAQKLIRSSASLHVEFIIRRVPFGNVFALQRASDGQNLGIVQEGNTAEIKDVLPNSVAARQGLTAKTPSCDGLSLTTWFLTEINGRPLNLFFKDNEVRDRLNAVGKEISILVQPHDFVKQIKKQLKNIRSYKDYIVQ